MKRILYATMQLPWPLDNGQKYVTVNDLTYLSRSFQIDVVCYIDPLNRPRQDEYLSTLRQRLPDVTFLPPVEHTILRGSVIRDKIPALLHGQLRRVPFVVSKYRSRPYTALLARLLRERQYDILYVESLNPSFILDDLPAELLRRVRVVYRAFDIFAETLALYAQELGATPTGLAVRADLLACRRYERRLWRRVDAIFNVTRRLGSLMVAEDPALAAKITYFPIFVEPPQHLVHSEPAPPNVLYIGTVHYPPNLLGLQWFLQHCWPAIRERVPAARLDIVGRGGEKLLPVPDGVTVHRYVDDIEGFYGQASVFVVPLFSGSGIRLKILDALNHGVPVVSTRAGYTGLEVREGHDLLVADEAGLFTAHVCQLLESESERRRLAAQGRAFVEQNHHPALAAQAILHVLESM
jgi:glycosyltransferase involved in cell wall biosynthesis